MATYTRTAFLSEVKQFQSAGVSGADVVTSTDLDAVEATAPGGLADGWYFSDPNGAPVGPFQENDYLTRKLGSTENDWVIVGDASALAALYTAV